ncbi:MAG: DUF5683 domain-containing protein [Balneola sp.]
MIWSEFLGFLIRNSVAILLLIALTIEPLNAQYLQKTDLSYPSYSAFSIADSTQKTKYPDPKSVLRRSLIIPGWGQLTNKQVWKVPIVYGLIGGLSYYSVYLTKQYHDYRAAYYNSFSSNNDMRFGPTPDYLAGQGAASLKKNRDFLRNRRDFIYVTVFLSYVLNAVDAYVFAHLRPFDVSDDLSMNRRFEADTITNPFLGDIPSISLSIKF